MVRSRRCGTLLLVAILRYTRVLVFCTWFILLSSSSMTPIKEQMIKLVLGENGIGCDFFVYGFDLGREIYFSLQSSKPVL